MPNSLTLSQEFTTLLDLKFKKSAITSFLEVNDQFVRGFDGSATVQLMNISTDGLGDYNRATGFPDGDVTTTWEPYTIDFDRAKSFQIDVMDNEESRNNVFIETSREFMRLQVIPEVDATRFARMASLGTTTTNEDFTTGDDIITAIDRDVLVLDDAEVPSENRVMFVSNTVFSLLKNASKITRNFEVDSSGDKVINRNFWMFDDMPVIKVPAGRFSTAVTLGANGFTKTGTDINYMIVQTNVVKAITRHVKVRVFTNDTNQDADAFKYQYRLYHDLIISNNETDGVITSAKTA